MNAEKPEEQPCQILLIDEGRTTHPTTRSLLESGRHVIISEIEYAKLPRKTREFDVVIADNVLPGSRGYETVKDFVEYEPWTPILILTDQPTVAEAVAALRIGAADYLSKPITAAELQQAIDAAVTRAQHPGRGRALHRSFALSLSEGVFANSLENLIYAFTHDMRRPVRAIHGFATALQEDLPSIVGERHPELLEYIEKIRKAGALLAESSDELVMLFRTPGQSKPILLAKTLEGVVQNISSPVSSRILFDVPNEPYVIMAERHFLEQAFFNLAVNASEAVTGIANGLVEISTQRIPDRNSVRVIVRDNGPGIADKFERLIFQPGFTTKSTGWGFGLFLARRAIIAHNGSIEYRRTAEAGTEFIVELPLAPEGTETES